MKVWIVTIVLFLGFVTGNVVAQDEGPRILQIAENESGKVWANLSLTSQRTGEPYLPIVVGIQNKSEKSVEINRENVWLTDLDGIVYPMPTVRQLRKGYDRMAMDYRMVSTGGIPWEVWVRTRHLAEANFFPDLRATRGNTTKDRITLREGYGMVDLLYFETPRTLAVDRARPIILDVHATGWETPIRLRLVIP